MPAEYGGMFFPKVNNEFQYKYAVSYFERAVNDKYHRLRAWEFLWDHLQSIPTWKGIANVKNLEKSALHLGFYLANWGMFRGSSELLNVNIKFFEDFVSVLFTDIDSEFWDLTLDDFRKENLVAQETFDHAVKIICDFENKRISWTDTLVTKVLLGVWGHCPARDTVFKKGFSKFIKRSHYGRQPRTSGRYLVYLNQVKQKESWAMPKFQTIAGNNYPPGKIIDMAFFEYGWVKT